MAAEAKNFIGDVEGLLTKAKENLPLILDQILNMQIGLVIGILMTPLSADFSRTDAIELITNLTRIIDRAVLEQEKKAMHLITQSTDIECLTTDTHGSKTARKLAETGIPWATGIPLRGLTVAVVHPDIGIAGSNKNALTIADYEKFCQLLLDNDPSYAQPPRYPYAPNYVVTPDSLVSTAHGAASEALDEFVSISPDGLVPRDSMFMISGLDFLQDNQFPIIIDAVINARRQDPAVISCVAEDQSMILPINHSLGERRGIIYGGKTHPTLSQPTFYSLHDVK